MTTWFTASYVLLWILVVVAILFNAITFRQLGVLIMGSARGVQQSGIPVGRRLPHLRLEAFTGKSWSPENEAGNPYLLFFGATYCKDCASILPVLRRLYRSTGLRIVPMIFGEDSTVTSRYAREMGVWQDAIPIDQATGHRFDVAVVPFAYAVDRNGVIRAKGLAGTAHQLQEFVRACGVTMAEETWQRQVITAEELAKGNVQ